MDATVPKTTKATYDTHSPGSNSGACDLSTFQLDSYLAIESTVMDMVIRSGKESSDRRLRAADQRIRSFEKIWLNSKAK